MDGHTETFWTDTREKGGSHSQFCLPKICPLGFTKRNHWILHIFKFERLEIKKLSFSSRKLVIFEQSHVHLDPMFLHRQFSLPKNHSRRVITCFRGSQKKRKNLTQFKFDKRSRTTPARFLQSFALPDEAVRLQLSEGTSCEIVRFVFASFSKHNKRFERQYRHDQRLPFSNFVHRHF